MTQKAVQIKIILKNTSPVVWRRIQILEGASLRTLHYAIQDVFGWKGYHSYVFKIDEDEFSDPEFDNECEGWLDDAKTKVGAIVKKCPEFEFIYDFGDWWEHQIIFEKFVDADMKEKYPVCTDGQFAAPPEDCGGPPGFKEFKEAVTNSKHKRHKELTGWFAATNFEKIYDPKAFDLEWTNMRIGRRQKPREVKSPLKRSTREAKKKQTHHIS